MYKVKQFIENLTTRTINENIYVRDGIVFIKDESNEFKYQNQQWYIKSGGEWINLQGGIPSIQVETNLDEDIFEDTDVSQEGGN